MAIKRFSYALIFLILFLGLFPLTGKAEVNAWKIIPTESKLTFTGMMNNSPTSGEFKSFNGEIYFDSSQLDKSRVRIVVDTSSVSTSYTDIAETLKTKDWFDIKNFPQAIFTAQQFSKIENNNYQAKGMLTLLNQTLPIVVVFAEKKATNDRVEVEGKTTIKRTEFGIGKGEWASTDDVGDEVTINFTLTAVKKK